MLFGSNGNSYTVYNHSDICVYMCKRFVFVAAYKILIDVVSALIWRVLRRVGIGISSNAVCKRDYNVEQILLYH